MKSVRDGVIMGLLVIVFALCAIAAVVAPMALIKFCVGYLRG